MDPERLLRRICERHGLPAKAGRRLIPLVRKALESPPRVRDRILSLVERNLARDGSGEGSVDALIRDLDQEVLVSVAKVLHGWTPSPRVLEMGGTLPDGLAEPPAEPDARE